MSYSYLEEPNYMTPRPPLVLSKPMLPTFATSPNTVAIVETPRSVSSCTTSSTATTLSSLATNALPPSAVFPRSASEASFDNSNNKYRQLPCRTFISVGTCPYRERCVYLHDPRCICREAKTKTRRKNKDDTALDAIFWPIMPYNLVAQKLDNTRQPHVIQHYVVPVPQQDQYRHHDQSVYSMWMHFVDFCLANADPLGVEKATVFSAPDLPVNAYTKQSRLAIFRQLSSTPASSTSTTPSKAASNTTSTTKVRENNQVMGAGLTSMKLVQVPVLAISRLEGNSQSHLASPARKVVNSLVDAENDEYNSSGPPMSTKAQGMPLVHRNRESFDSLESLSSSEAAHSRRNSIDSESYFPSHDGYPVYLDNTENDSDARTSPDGSNSNWGSVHSKDVEVHFASSHSYPSTSIAQSFAHQNMVNHAHHQVIHHHQQQQLHHYGHHGGSATIQMLKHRAELHPSHSMGRSMPTSMMDYNNHYY